MMKEFLALFLMIVMASCSSTGSKMVDPTSTDFVSGEVAKYVQVADQPAEISFSRSEENDSTQYIRLKTSLIMKTDGFDNMKADEVLFQDTLSVAMVDLQDGEGGDVTRLHLSGASLPALQTLLTGSAGDTAEVVFEAVCHDRKDARNRFRAATKFTPSLTADVEPVVVGFHLMTGYTKLRWGVKHKYEFRLMLDGSVTYTCYTYLNDTGKTESISWRGTWTSDSYERGNGWVGYYDLLITGWGGSTIEYFIPKSLDYLYDEWLDMKKNNTNAGYRIVKSEKITKKKS